VARSDSREEETERGIGAAARDSVADQRREYRPFKNHEKSNEICKGHKHTQFVLSLNPLPDLFWVPPPYPKHL
jgi:hypothetical protein